MTWDSHRIGRYLPDKDTEPDIDSTDSKHRGRATGDDVTLPPGKTKRNDAKHQPETIALAVKE